MSQALFRYRGKNAPACRLCSSAFGPFGKRPALGICSDCMGKILVLVFAIMVLLSFATWFVVT